MNDSVLKPIAGQDITLNLTHNFVKQEIAGNVIGQTKECLLKVCVNRSQSPNVMSSTSFTPPQLTFTAPERPTTTKPVQQIEIAPEYISASLPYTRLTSSVHDAGEKIEYAKTIDTKAVSIRSSVNLSFGASEEIGSFSELNRSDVTEMFANQNLLTPSQITFLRTIQRKQQLHPLRYRDDYLRHSSILLLANGWSSAQRYSMCSISNSVNRSGQCKLHKFCPYCSYLAKQTALARYVPCYNSGTWHFLTGSFTGDLRMTGPSDYYDLLHYWDAYKSALRTLVTNKSIRGVFWTEELAINSIAPTLVLPHIHAIIEADSIEETTIQTLNELVKANLAASLGPDHLTPNIQIKNLNTQRKLLSHIQYQIKPLKIVKAYDTAWARSYHNSRAGSVQLNSQTTDLVLGYSTITKDRIKLNSAGNLCSKAKCYIGTKKKGLKSALRIVKEVMQGGDDYIEMTEGKDEGLATVEPFNNAKT